MDEIAHAMNTDRRELQSWESHGRPSVAAMLSGQRRKFTAKAFSEGYSVEHIMEYIDRPENMVLHALRMTCMDLRGGPYGRDLAQLRLELRS
jgi:hypothetical protein